MKKRKKKSKIYFGTPVHDAIVKYNNTKDVNERNKIYTEQIHAAFLKLAENIINTFKFSYFDYGFRDLQEEVVSNLVINMHKLFKKTIDYFNDNVERLFPKEQDREIAESILYLCKNKDNIDNFNKKAIYIMIREMTDVKTSKITQVTNTFRKIYPKIQEEVLSKGHLDNLRYTGSLV